MVTASITIIIGISIFLQPHRNCKYDHIKTAVEFSKHYNKFVQWKFEMIDILTLI